MKNFLDTIDEVSLLVHISIVSPYYINILLTLIIQCHIEWSTYKNFGHFCFFSVKQHLIIRCLNHNNTPIILIWGTFFICSKCSKCILKEYFLGFCTLLLHWSGMLFLQQHSTICFLQMYIDYYYYPIQNNEKYCPE